MINVRGVRARRGAVTVGNIGEATAAAPVHLRGNLLHSSDESYLEQVAGQQVIRRRGHPADFRLRRNRGRVDSSGEVKNPARTVPRSAYLALVITTTILHHDPSSWRRERSVLISPIIPGRAARRSGA